MTLWSGRMASGPAAEMMAFTQSLATDYRLAADDLRGSLAHIHGLGRTGILRSDEVEELEAALDTVASELATGAFSFVETDEDIHTAIERRVTELAGDTGAKLHTGRSRNDQVATATRLYARRALANVADELLVLLEILGDRAEEAGEAYLPGYTHLQRAQPVALAHQLLAHGWALARDLDRLVDAHRRCNVSPLGAGALGGSTLPLDPDGVAVELGFDSRFQNSLDAVADRDFVAEALFVLSLLGVHLSRLGEEVVIYSSEEFGFYRLGDAWSTGSSMLPQKKNPDIAELARGKAGRLIGRLTGLLVTLKGIPLAYNRDLQEDKEPLFDALDTVLLELPALSGLMGSLVFDTERMATAADSETIVAVDLAEWLVLRGTSFREAHRIVGGLVRESAESGARLRDLVGAHPALGPDALGLLDPGTAVERRGTPGGGGTAAVATQLVAFRAQLGFDRSRADSLAR